jgi:hypothetical protein
MVRILKPISSQWAVGLAPGRERLHQRMRVERLVGDLCESRGGAAAETRKNNRAKHSGHVEIPSSGIQPNALFYTSVLTI